MQSSKFSSINFFEAFDLMGETGLLSLNITFCVQVETCLRDFYFLS